MRGELPFWRCILTEENARFLLSSTLHMKKIGSFVIAISFLLPAGSVLAAQQGSGMGASAGIQQQDQVRDPSTHTSSEPDQTQLQTRDQIHLTASSSGGGIQEQDRDQLQIHLEASTTPIHTSAQLQQTLQDRARQLDVEVSSTSPKDQQILRNENQVRLAVHALLASEQALGGIGPQVSEIARQINNSVTVTANTEAQIQTRSFWSRLFFGGDKAAAQTIQEQVTQNQARIQQLTQLIGQATVSADIAAQLKTQLSAMQQEQVRLQALAQDQLHLWGIFSWRF